MFGREWRRQVERRLSEMASIEYIDRRFGWRDENEAKVITKLSALQERLNLLEQHLGLRLVTETKPHYVRKTTVVPEG